MVTIFSMKSKFLRIISWLSIFFGSLFISTLLAIWNLWVSFIPWLLLMHQKRKCLVFKFILNRFYFHCMSFLVFQYINSSLIYFFCVIYLVIHNFPQFYSTSVGITVDQFYFLELIFCALFNDYNIIIKRSLPTKLPSIWQRI